MSSTTRRLDGFATFARASGRAEGTIGMYASTIYRRTGDLLVLGELLGHSSPAHHEGLLPDQH